MARWSRTDSKNMEENSRESYRGNQSRNMEDSRERDGEEQQIMRWMKKNSRERYGTDEQRNRWIIKAEKQIEKKSKNEKNGNSKERNRGEHQR